MKFKILPVAASLAAFFFFLSTTVYTQGLYISSDRPTRDMSLTPSTRSAVVLVDRRIHAEIKEAGATVQVTETFHNNTTSVMEGTYVFPMPRMAAATGLSLYINGEEIQGEVLDAGKARAIYADIVRRARDPGLLEYIGQGLLRASIYPIPPGGDVAVKLSYLAAVEPSGSLYNFNFPLKTSAAGDPTTAVDVHIASRLPVRNIYSPSHEIDVYRSGDYDVQVTYEGRGADAKNFSLYYSLSEGDFGFSLLAHSSPASENYFMLMISPKLEVEAGKVIPRDTVFVIDKSGSMKGEKWRQAKEALKYCIKSLNPEDRFGLLAFSTEPLAFRPGLTAAEDAAKEEACGFLDSLSVAGGTNIHEALMKALGMLADSSRLCMLAFLTDGLPTVNVTDPDQIIREVQGANRRHLRIFNFGVGYDVNTYLLDSLAEGSRGATDYIEEGEDIEVKVSGYYAKISDPVLSDVKLSFYGVNPHDLYPPRMEDLFAGSALTVTGKLEKTGKAAVVLTGQVNGKEQRFEFRGDFTPKPSDGHDFLPRYWAMRKIGYLLNQIRLHGLNDELKEEVIALGKRFGLVTPYTSALVVEEGARLARAANVPVQDGNSSGSSGFLSGRGRADAEERLRLLAGRSEGPPSSSGPTTGGPRGATTGGLGRKRTGGGGTYRGPGDSASPPSLSGSGDVAAPGSRNSTTPPSSPRAPQSGKDKVQEAKKLNRMARVGRNDPAAENREGGNERIGVPQVVQAGGSSFHRIGDLFVDSRFKEEMREGMKRIEAYGECYFKLLAEHPELKGVFALGEHIIFVMGDAAYEVAPPKNTGGNSSK